MRLFAIPSGFAEPLRAVLVAACALGLFTLPGERDAGIARAEGAVVEGGGWPEVARDAALWQHPPSAREAIAEYQRWAAEQPPEAGIEPSDRNDEPWDTLDGCMTSEMADKNTPGASVAVVLEGELAYARGYGLKHAELPDAPDEATLFRIGSTTKMMTAAALMQQVEAGTIDLQAPVTDILPEFDVAGAWEYPNVSGQDITPWHLLTHSGAFFDDLIAAATLDAMQGPTTTDALAEWALGLADTPLHAPPGAFWNYSNPNFSLAGRLVEVVTERAYNDVIVEDLWRPAGMETTFMLPSEVMTYGNYSYGHGLVDAMGNPVPPVAPDAYDHFPLGPAGMAFSTPSDMVRWAKLLMDGGGDVLLATSVEAMQGEQMHMGVIPGQWYGYGIFVEDVGETRIYNHGGNVPGWSSQLFWVPETDFAISILANDFQSLSRSAGCALVNVMGLEPPERVDYSTPPETWVRYEGDYRGLTRIGSELEMNLTLISDTLQAVLIDGLGPGMNYTTTLQQAALDTFLIDVTSDGQPDTDLTFIDDPDEAGSVRWLRNRAFVLTRQTDAPGQATPTLPGPTATAPPPATATAMPPPPTATVAPQPTEPPLVVQPESCPRVEALVPAPALQAALANPREVRGYGQRCFPEQPVSPFNPLRKRLGLQNPNRPYHPVFNDLMFKCGCP
jgi:CubicO group peptidase (beta-lactamase class C family)